MARGSAKPPNYSAEIDAETEQILQERLKANPELAHSADLPDVRPNPRAGQGRVINSCRRAIRASGRLTWVSPKIFCADKPLQLRVKFNAARKEPVRHVCRLVAGGRAANTGNVWRSEPMSLAPDTFHEFEIPPNLFDSKGVLTIVFVNANNTTLLFPLEDGMEVLYPEGGFALNFARGLGIIFCWMALLAALGLAAASFLSFPVAAFFSLAVLVVGAFQRHAGRGGGCRHGRGRQRGNRRRRDIPSRTRC